jgi:hypothetical protein
VHLAAVGIHENKDKQRLIVAKSQPLNPKDAARQMAAPEDGQNGRW